MKRVVSPARLEGAIRVPGDKSISHRAVMLNGIAEGQGRIRNFLEGADCLATVACMRALGVEIHGTETLTVSGVGLHGLQEPTDVLNAENSGTTMRLLTGLLAAQPFFTVMTGDESLRRRPMDRIIQPLRLMGAEVRGRQEDKRPPLAILGRRLKSIRYTLPVASAQLKSALLLAGLFADGKTTIVEPVPTRDHTERMLTAMGARVCSYAAEEGGNLVTVEPATALSALDLEAPGDLSSAAFWLVAAAAHPDAHLILECVGVNPTRTGILDILKSMGARLSVLNRRMEGGEPVADISVESSGLTGTEVAGGLISRAIDDIPVLAVAAAVASGTTIIRDASELRVKESDRIAALATELRRLGAKAEELPDGLIIHGGTKLDGASCKAYGDHRLAMALAVAGLVARGETTIDDDGAVQVSYPGFWRDLDRVSKGTGVGG
ncbi:MAG: 3-phosphoshikimate 1-carboxyvinyltransferase [Dehalococcoidia bacterium]|nr:3-phosphoshikimate 1-carboxyvinyltransferase [Dehalococcoidia bacterium]